MAGSSAALTDDDILAAYSKPAPVAASAAPGQASADDTFLQAYSKPPPAPIAAEPTLAPSLDPTSPVPQGIDVNPAADLNAAATAVAAPVTAAVGRVLAPLQPGTTELGPTATAADLPPDSPGATMRGSGSLPVQDIDAQATFNALSARRNALLADGKDPKQDPEYRNLLQLQAKAFAQNNQAGARSLTPGMGAVGGGVAGLIERGANRLVATPEAAGNALLAAPTEAPMAAVAVAPSVASQEASAVTPTWNRLAAPAGAPGDAAAAPLPTAANPLILPPVAPAASANRLLAPAELPPAATSAPIVTPTDAPTQKFFPVRTPEQADAEADRIIAHFAGNGSTTIAPQDIIPGSTQTLSRAIEGGNPGISGLESRIAETFPNDFVALDKANQAARAAHFDALAGSPADVAAASGERDAAFAAADRAVFDPANVKPTDPSPVIAQIDQVLAGREGQRSAVASALQDVRSKLVDADGNLQTDPDLLYGVRKDINDAIAPAAKGTANDKTQAARELISIRNALDPVIEAGAPGFTKFIGDYSAASAPIDGMKYLQSMRLTDTQGNITLQKLDTAIKSLERIQALPGARVGDGVSADQMAGLNALRDDMRLDAKRHLGKAVGSNTVQNLGTNRVLSTLGHPLIGATGIGSAFASPWAAAAALGARHLLMKAGDKGQEMVFEALRRKLLNPQDAASAFQPR